MNWLDFVILLCLAAAALIAVALALTLIVALSPLLIGAVIFFAVFAWAKDK